MTITMPDPRPDVVEPGTADPAGAALAPMVEVWFRILTDHVPDAGGRCHACTGVRRAPWPCPVRSVAESARAAHAADRPDRRVPRGRFHLRGPRGTSCAVTPRERQFLQSAADGRTDDEVAAHLDVPERTVRTTLRRLTRTLAVADRTALLVLALRNGAVV